MLNELLFCFINPHYILDRILTSKISLGNLKHIQYTQRSRILLGATTITYEWFNQTVQSINCACWAIVFHEPVACSFFIGLPLALFRQFFGHSNNIFWILLITCPLHIEFCGKFINLIVNAWHIAYWLSVLIIYRDVSLACLRIIYKPYRLA